MEAFSTRRSRDSNLAKQQARMKRSYNPVPSQSHAQIVRIGRTLDAIKERLDFWLTETEGGNRAWFPYEGSITAKSEEHYYLVKDLYETSARDDYGYLADFHEQKQRATNRLTVASWYQNANEDGFYIIKTIYSPLPCDTWGWLPLTRIQWNKCVLEIMTAHMHWQWVHAVREYTGDPTFEPGGITGWHTERAKGIYTKDYEPCIGQVIYAHVIEKYSALVAIEQATPCLQ